MGGWEGFGGERRGALGEPGGRQKQGTEGRSVTSVVSGTDTIRIWRIPNTQMVGSNDNQPII